MRLSISTVVGLLLLSASIRASAALPGESIILNPHTGDYTITYWDFPKSPKKQLRQAIFVPSTKIVPTVGSEFQLRKNEEIKYFYRVVNNSRSRQSLVALRLDQVSGIISAIPLLSSEPEIDDQAVVERLVEAGIEALTTPTRWNGGSYASPKGGLLISWSYAILNEPKDGLMPGDTQGGFGFLSKDLPGIGVAELSGHAPVSMYPGEGPTGDLGKELETIEQNDFVSRPAAVPTIAVPAPFDAALLLDRIRAEMQTWPAKQLLDPAFAAQLDRYLVAAAEAYRLNNIKAGKEHIDTLRKLLERDHKHLDHDDEDNDDPDERKAATHLSIDRLAARVLDFDLRYVLKRTEHGHEHEHKEGDHGKER
ncbi:MAG: hypothetical protein HZB47_11865 [Nitrosomonadales bacterium]|nr:hypothetical protein [Nitrosomonadales bacterium]